MRSYPSRALLAAAVTLGIIGGQNAQATSSTKYKVVNLGGPTGGTSRAYGISSTGHVVGQTSASGNNHAFRWDPTSPNGPTGSRADIHPSSGATSSVAYGMNAAGVVVGAYVDDLNGYGHAYRTGALAQINPATDNLSGSATTGAAYAINDSGLVVGQSGSRAFRSSGSAVQVSDLIGPGSGSSTGLALDSSGNTVGTLPSGALQHAAKATTGNSMTDLMGGGSGFGTLLAISAARGINGSGVVVGDVTTDDEATIHHAFMTTAGGILDNTAIDLGTLGGTNSYAYAINSSGVIVGTAQVASGAYHAFIYNGSMVDLNTLLDSTGTGWVLSEATGINDIGQICATGVDPVSGQQRAVLLTSPEVFGITSISPTQVLVGSGNFTLTVNGGAFASNAVVKWKTTALTTHFVNSTQLTADVPGKLIAKTATIPITVVNPGPNVSNQVKLKILPYLKSVKMTPSSQFGGLTATGTVEFNFPAPVGGATVTLSSENPALASVPGTASLSQGSLTSSPFSVTTTTVTIDTITKIDASYAGVLRKGNFKVKPPALLSVTFNPVTVTGGSMDSQGTVTLTSPAPKGGWVVSLSSSNGAITVPDTVTVSEGNTAATFKATSHTVTMKTPVTISGTVDGGIHLKKGKITVMP